MRTGSLDGSGVWRSLENRISFFAASASLCLSMAVLARLPAAEAFADAEESRGVVGGEAWAQQGT